MFSDVYNTEWPEHISTTILLDFNICCDTEDQYSLYDRGYSNRVSTTISYDFVMFLWYRMTGTVCMIEDTQTVFPPPYRMIL